MVSAKQVKKEAQDEHDTRLKRRLMGTAVLIALAVIFLPLIFDGSGTESHFKSIEPLQSEPPYDAQSLEEITLPELSNPTVIDFIDKNPSNNNYQAAEAQTQILEPPAPNRATEPAPVAIVKPDSKVVTEVKNELQAAPDPLSKSWLIQIASFSDKINALSMRSELRKSGYPVIVKAGTVDAKSVFRVYVGPLEGKNTAFKVKQQLETELQKQTLLIAE